MANRQPKAPQPSDLGRIPLNPNSIADQDVVEIGTYIDPYDQFNQERSWFKRRMLLYSLGLRCGEVTGAAHSIANDLAAQELYITPTETNPSATTLREMDNTATLLNQMQGKPGGIHDYYLRMVQAVWFAKSGLFVATPRDGSGSIHSIAAILPTVVYPYFGWQKATMFGMLDADAPLFDPQKLDAYGNPLSDITGVFYTDAGIDGGRYYVLESNHYYQMCVGATGAGPFQTNIPIGETLLNHIVSLIGLNDYMRGIILNTDMAQVVLWNNINPATIENFSKTREALLKRKRNGEPVDPAELNKRLHLTSQDPLQKASVEAVNIRIIPEGFDIQKHLKFLQSVIANGLGINQRRMVAEYASERFGNATNAAMLNNDEPGVRALKTRHLAFVAGHLMAGVNASAHMVAESTPENYATVQRDVALAQIASQMASVLPDSGKGALFRYMQRMGFFAPSDLAGIDLSPDPAVPTPLPDGKQLTDQNGVIENRKSKWPVIPGYASVRNRDGSPLLTRETITLQQGTKAVQAGFDVTECMAYATDAYNQWVANGLPRSITSVNGTDQLNYNILSEQVNNVANRVWQQIVQCFENAIPSTDEDVHRMIVVIRTGFFNAFAAPDARPGLLDQPPQRNLFNALWTLAGGIALGRKSIADLQKQALNFASYIARYYNALRSAVYMQQGKANPDVPCDWIRHAAESCPDCVKFSGHYNSFTELLRVTRGVLPGDLRLTCSGNCKCELIFNTAPELVGA